MKGKKAMTRTIKKVVSVILALALVITSLNYTPSTIKAATKSVTYTDGRTYTISDENSGGGLIGFECNGIGDYWFSFAWANGTTLKMEITATNSKDETVKIADNSQNPQNTIQIPIGEGDVITTTLASLASGEYTLTFYVKESAGNFTAGQYGTAKLTISGESSSEEATTTSQNTDETVTETESSELNWQSDANLTATFGEGARYASTGSVPIGSMQIQSDQLYWRSGSELSPGSIKLSVNGVVPAGGENTGNSALGYPIKYSTLNCGLNTIIVEETDSASTVYTYTFYVDIPVQPMNLYVNNYSTSTGKYIVKFDGVDDAATYKVYIDGNATDITLGGSADYFTCDEISSYAAGKHDLQLSAVLSDDTETGKSAKVSFTIPETKGTINDIAQVYVQTDDTSINPLTGLTKDKVQASITIVDQTGTYSDIYDDATKTTIKVRGNSTAGAEKKAYNIALSSAQYVFGMGSAKKWSLLANAFDKTLIRNKLAMDLGGELGIPYNSQSRYVDMYINGRYMGNFLLIESIETGTNRVNISADDTASNDILLELDNKGRDVATDAHLTARTTRYKEYFAINAPEGDPSDETKYEAYKTKYETKLSNALTHLNNFEAALETNDYEQIATYIDVDSFVNYYLVNEIFKNQDINFSSTRFYISNNKLYAGPMWDLDLSSGNLWTTDNGGNEYTETDRSPQGYKATTMKWFEKLMANSTFKQKVVKRYENVVLPKIQAMYADKGTIDTLINSISGSITRNYVSTDEGGAGWSVSTADSGDTYSYAKNPGWSTYDESITYLKTWLSDRVTYLSSEWLSEEETTTEEVTVPEDAAWNKVSSTSNYYYYISDADAKYIANKDVRTEDVYFAFNAIFANIKSAILDNETTLKLVGKDGVAIPKTYLSTSGTVHKVTIVAQNDTTMTLYVKLETPPDYAPKGPVATADATTKLATVKWAASYDAISKGCTYTVQIGDLTAVNVSGTETSVDISTLEYGDYTVTVNAILNDEVVGTTTTTLQYKDPEAVDSTVTFVDNKWEQNRDETVSWTAVDGVTGYAVYADGVLYQQYTSDTLKVSVPAYAFANHTNKNGQPTTVATTHETTVVALFNNDTAPQNLNDVDSKKIMGKNKFPLYVNYIFGNGTSIWNENANSVWNFTICEATGAPDTGHGTITEGADAVITYDTDGAALVTINDVGKHSTYESASKTGDQAWTIKASIYNGENTKGELENLSFDITGPSSLIGKKIQIKCCPEEYEGDDYSNVEYSNQQWTFEDDGNGGAIIHYSTSFTATNDTYDLFFGLGLLQDPDAENPEAIDIALSDASITKVYGLTSLTPSAALDSTDNTKNGIYVSWQTDVPNHLANEYTYNVYINDILVKEKADNNSIYTGYEAGTYKVKVESIYNGAITSSLESNVEIQSTDLPDLVISDISIPEGEYHIGETVPVSVTIKNIGTANATPATGNLTVWLYSGKDITNNPAGVLHYTVEENNKTLAPGASYTGTINYTIKAEDDKGGYLFDLMAKADTDNGVNGNVAESNENNNTLVKTFKFYAPIGDVTLTNDGTNIQASWAEHDETNAKFIVKYTDATTGEIVQIETADNTPNITFPEGTLIANNTEVEVTSVHTDSSTHVYAKGTALADLAMVSARPVNGVAYVGEDSDVVVEFKNVGVALATRTDDIANKGLFPVKTRYYDGTQMVMGNWANYESGILAPNQSGEATITNGIKAAQVTAFGTYTSEANVDDASEGAGVILESDDPNVDTTRNNFLKFTFIAIDKGTITLNNADGTVSATWTDPNTTNESALTVEGYQLTYITNGVAKSIEVTGTTYTFTEPIDNNTDVIVSAKYTEIGGTYYQLATTKALADLIITTITKPDNTYLNVEFDLQVEIKNQGTAQVNPSEEKFVEGDGGWIIVSMEQDENITANTLHQGHIATGLLAGATDTITLSGIKATVIGDYTLNVKVDSPGFVQADATGFIAESDETNNIEPITFSIVEKPFSQEKMDWEPIVDDANKTATYNFTVGGTSQKAHIFYKILDTTNKTHNYIDIIPSRVGYDGSYMSLHWYDGYYPINEITGDSGGTNYGTTDTKVYMALIADMEENTINNAEWEHIALDNFSYVDSFGNVAISGARGESPFIVNGNGFNYNVGNFGLYKYYLMKIEKADGDSITIAYKVTDENDEMGTWIQAMPNLGNEAINPDKLPFYYHDKSCETTGGLWYDSSDLKLTSISCYNVRYLALHISDVVPTNSDVSNIRIDMAYASVDSGGKFVQPAEDQYQSVPIYNKEGTHTLQLELPTLMKEFPIHSDKGGSVDDEYYSMRVYYDRENAPDEYVNIPVRIKADIPMIESVNGLAVAAREDNLSVSWTNTSTQDAHGYLYDVYINGALVSENVPAGVYNFTGYDVQTIDKQYSVKVIAKWCEQSADATYVYTVEEETEPTETLPGEEITYPDKDDQKWVLISGENILPIKVHNTVSREVNAKIYYYTDVDMDSVVGYNGSYIALNGSDKYFTGDSSKIFVQDGNSTTFVMKGIYDNFYPTKILMQSAKMFSTYDGWKTDDGNGGTIYNTLYYTVRVVGDNGNTYKDFYFKVVPTDEGYSDSATGEWREISGESELPVKIGSTSLQGKIYYYDHPAKTNTYDIVGYNGYYMSVIGKSQYYTGTTTSIKISKALDSETIETDTDNILADIDEAAYEFTSKDIADKVYSGQIIIKSEDTFTVAYGTNYYLLQVNGIDDSDNATVTYVPIKIVVSTGDVEIQGFQMNTDTSAGAVSEFNPSFRVVSKSSKVMSIKNKLYEVKGYGTVYALEDNLAGNYGQMTIGGGEGVHSFAATAMGTYNGYTSGNGDEKYYNYYALTFKGETYYYNSLTAKYAFRAYAVLDNPEGADITVYGENVYSASIYEIAENLYDNSKMPNVEAHNFLYDNVLNIVAIGNNRNGIAAAMNKALGVTSAKDEDYQLVNAAYKDLYNYIHCKAGYTYLERGTFKCSNSTVETELLEKLKTKAGTAETTLADWIYKYTTSYHNSQGVKYKGFYELVPYDWDSNIFKDYDSE